MNINYLYPKKHTAAQISTKRPALIDAAGCISQIKKNIISVHSEVLNAASVILVVKPGQ